MKHVIAGFVAFLSLFSISACIEKNTSLGTAMIPTNQDISIRTAEFDLPVDLRLADSLQSTVAQSATVGAIRTKAFGLFRSDAAMTVTSYSDSIEWGRNAKVKRIYISLARDSSLVVDPSQFYIPQNIYVHELTTQLDSTKAYNNSLTADDYSPEVISSTDVIYTGSDGFSIDLKKEYGEKFLRLPMEVRDSAELLMKEIPGLYLTCDVPEEGIEGGRLNVFDLSSSTLILNYTYDDEQGNHRSSTAIFSLGEYYALNVSSSGAGSLVTDNPTSAIYMEGLCGIKPHIQASTLRRQMEQWSLRNDIPLANVIIAKASIEFPFEYSGDPDQFYAWSSNLFPCKKETSSSTGRRIYSPLSEISESTLESGDIDRSHLYYKANISIYLQDLIRRDLSEITTDDDLWIMPTVSYTDSYSNTYYYPDYYYYKQDVLNGTGSLRHPVLKLTYTILK